MTFVDTNYFLRFLLKDVNDQHLEAKRLLTDGSTGRIKLITSTIVFFEIYWVLSTYYKRNKEEVAKSLEIILDLKFIDLKERQVLQHSLSRFKKTNFDLEDCYNLSYAKARIAKTFKTFDQKLAKEFAKK